MRVYLVRHAKAEPAHRDGDERRALAPEGRRAFGALVAALGARLAPARVLTSPYLRCRETAALLPGGADATADPELASGALDGRALLALARRAGDGAALVGHNPELAEAIALAARAAHEVPPGTIAAIELGPGEPRLAWLEAP